MVNWPSQERTAAPEAGALAGRIRELVEGDRGDDAVREVVATAPDEVLREALHLVLAQPGQQFSLHWWFDYLMTVVGSRRARRLLRSPASAALAAQAYVAKPGVGAWARDPAADLLGPIVAGSVEAASAEDLAEVAGAVETVIRHRNEHAAGGEGTAGEPAQPPGRPFLEALVAIDRRDGALGRRLLDRLAEGPSPFAARLRHVLSGAAVPGVAGTERAAAALGLVALTVQGKGPEPGERWLQTWDELRGAHGAWIRPVLVDVAGAGRAPTPLGWGGLNSELARTAVFALSSWADTGTRDLLQATVLAWAGRAVGNPVVAGAAVWSLARPADREALTRLLDLQRRVRHRALAARLAEAVDRLAGAAGTTPDDLADERAPTGGLGPDGTLRLAVGDHVVTLALGPAGEVTREVRDPGGRHVAAVPAAVRRERPDDWAAVTRAAKEVRQAASQQRARLEEAMIAGRTWSAPRWQELFGGHPVLRGLARRLVWRIEEDGADWLAMPGRPEGWQTAGGTAAPGAGARLRVAHPVEMTADEQSAWQRRLVAGRVVQPFKQLFRETYHLTPAEVETGDRSHRFAGHVVPRDATYALAKSRGWSGTLGLSGFDGAGQGWREFPSWQVRAGVLMDWAGAPDWSTVTEVQFGRRAGRGWATMPLAEVPPIPFSEAMRDVDLIVAVAGIGTDATWTEWEARREAGEVDWEDQRLAYERLAEAPAAARAALLRELIPALGLEGRVRLEGRFALVQGRRASYRVHLGSANIHLEPSGRYLCIVPTAERSGPLYLPFEDQDRKTRELLSKVLLLAADDRIRDPAILAQIPPGAM